MKDTVPSRRLRVCLLAPMPPPYGGIGHWTQMIMKYATTRTDVSLHLIDTAPRWRAFHDVATWKRVLGGGAQLVRDLAKLVWKLLTVRPDAVHLTTSGQLAVARDLGVMVAARAFRTPVTYHIRFGRLPQIASARTREWAAIRWAMAMARAVITIDAATEGAILRHAPEVAVTRIPNCIDPAKLPSPSASPKSTRTVMYLGWVIQAKGIEELLEAWARLSPSGWRLLVVGPSDGAYQARLTEIASSNSVQFTGQMEHAAAMRELAAADVFVLPSYTEGFPNVVLEAMSLGKPVIATHVGAIPEMLANGAAGLLVSPGNASELAAALDRLLPDEPLQRLLGQCARERAREYSIDTVFEQYTRTWRAGAPASRPSPK